jgi:hypothetical protein
LNSKGLGDLLIREIADLGGSFEVLIPSAEFIVGIDYYALSGLG